MIFLIITLAFILRIINLNQSLWLDEAINTLATRQYSFFGILTKYSIADFHPPAYFGLLWLWSYFFGTWEIAVRSPSVIFGVGTVFLVYLLGRKLYENKIALIAALFMALSPLHVYYSQEARMYSMATFSATLSFYFFWTVLNKGGKKYWILYFLSNVLVLYSDYLVYLIFPSQLFFLIIAQRNFIKKMILIWLGNLSFLLPWLTIFPKQFSTGIAAASALPGWANVVGGATIKELLLIPLKTVFGRISFENNQIYAIVAGSVGLLFGFLILQSLKKPDKSTKLLICWIVIPTALAFIISFFVPVLSYFRMLFILPAFYLLLTKGGRLAIAGVCMISLVSLTAYYINPKFQREDWREAVNTINPKLGDRSLVLFENPDNFAPFVYYSKNLDKVKGGLKKVPTTTSADIKEVAPHINEIYLFEYLVDITDPNRMLEKSLESKGFKKTETLNFNGVGFVHHYQLQ